MLPLGTSREICTRGYQLMLGYFELPEATGLAITEDGWLRSGAEVAVLGVPHEKWGETATRRGHRGRFVRVR